MDWIPIGLAVEALKAGHKVTRAGWHGKGMYLWLCSQTDLLAEDWIIL